MKTKTKPKGPKAEELEKLKREAILEYQNPLTGARVETHRCLMEIKALGGEETYNDALLDVVKAYGTDGVLASELRDVFPDKEKLQDAREALKATGRILAVERGNSWHMQLDSDYKPLPPEVEVTVLPPVT